jgi:hypothetical protein
MFECDSCGEQVEQLFDGLCQDCKACEDILDNVELRKMPTSLPASPVRYLTAEDIGYVSPTWQSELERVLKSANITKVVSYGQFLCVLHKVVDDKRGCMFGWHALTIMMKLLKENPSFAKGYINPLKFLTIHHPGVQRILKDRNVNDVLRQALNKT